MVGPESNWRCSFSPVTRTLTCVPPTSITKTFIDHSPHEELPHHTGTVARGGPQIGAGQSPRPRIRSAPQRANTESGPTEALRRRHHPREGGRSARVRFPAGVPP